MPCSLRGSSRARTARSTYTSWPGLSAVVSDPVASMRPIGDTPGVRGRERG